MNEAKTWYQESFELHWRAVLGIVRYLITQVADESVEIAARAVALAAPLPNAINMYNVAVGDLGWSSFAALAFSLTLEIVVFLLVEIALLMWDGYLRNPKRFGVPFIVSIGIVLISVSVVMVIVYRLESHKIMALLPVVSLCSFVGIGLKRWNERGDETAKTTIVPEVETKQSPIDNTIERRKRLAVHLNDYGYDSLDSVANQTDSSKSIVRNDLLWLEKQQVIKIDRSQKQWGVEVNGHYPEFMQS